MSIVPVSPGQQPPTFDPYSYFGLRQGPPEELIATEIWRMLRKRKYLIVGCTVACLFLAGLYVLVRSPRYEAVATIEVSPAGTNSLGLDDLASKVLSPSDPNLQLQSAVAVLHSKTIALSVIKQLNLAERRDFAGRWVQARGTAMSSLSPEVRDHLLLRFQKNLKVEVIPKTDILSVQFRARDPRLAAEVVNTVVSSYTERNFRSSYDAATQVSDWLSKQMDGLKTQATNAQEKLAQLQREKGLIGVDETENIITEKLKGIDEQLTAAESDRIVKEARYRIAASGNPELIASMVPEPTLQVLRSQQAELRVEYARLSTKFGQGYPKLAELVSQMSQVDASIDHELQNLSLRYKNEYLAAGNAEDMLRARFEQQKQKAYDLNQGAAQYAILKHEVESTQDLYETLQLKLKQAGIVAGLASANIAVVEVGQVPSEPIDPRPMLDLLLGLGTGLGLGVLSAAAFEALDNTIRTSEEAEDVSELPVLAVIPRIGQNHSRIELKKLAPGKQDARPELVAFLKPRSQAAEAYRSLRTSLLLCSSRNAPKCVVITSSVPAEGKTLTAVNCAAVLAQQGAKVLLVDADLRQPSLHQALGIPQSPGLSGMLAGVCNESEAIAQLDTIPNLAVLPSGAIPPYPAEMLTSRKLLELMDKWRGEYDHVLLDTPPVSVFTDAVVLGARSDAVLLMARSCFTTRQALRHTRDLLQRANATIAGIVLNGVDLRYEDSYYRSYGSRHRTGKEAAHD